jgi:hypothetical protein
MALIGFAGSVAAQQGKKGAQASDPDQVEMTGFHLNLDNLERFAAASKGMMKYPKEKQSLQDAMSDSADARTISGMVRTVEKYPALAREIKSAGLTVRDYSVMSGTLVTTAMAVGMRKQGILPQIPPTVSAENAAFVEKNYDKIDALMKSLRSAEEQ